MNDEKDYKNMAFDEAIELNPPEFYEWCKANPCFETTNNKLSKEIKGNSDEDN